MVRWAEQQVLDDFPLALLGERLFLDGRYEVPDQLLILCTDVGELDPLAFLACPYYCARDLDKHTGGWQAE